MDGTFDTWTGSWLSDSAAMGISVFGSHWQTFDNVSLSLPQGKDIN